jgi:hypothetical protein
MPQSLKSRILGDIKHNISDIKRNITRNTKKAFGALRRLPNVSRRRTGTVGGKRKQSKKRRKSLTNTNMKIGKRSPQKKHCEKDKTNKY